MEQFRLKKELPYLVFVLPAFALYTIFTIIPLISSFMLSLTSWNGYSLENLKFVGLSNYSGMFSDEAIRISIKNTLIYASAVPFFITLFAIPLSLALNSNMLTKNLQRSIFFFPSVPSAIILGYVWGYMMSPMDNGILNIFLGKFGIRPVMWLADPNMALVSMIIISIWAGTGWHACIYLAGLQGISAEYYEAARIDGAGKFSMFKYITFPMLAPAMTISVMLNITGSLKVFDLPFTLTQGGPGYATMMMTQMIIKRGVVEKLYGKATAMAVVFFVIILLITTIQLSLMKRREEGNQ